MKQKSKAENHTPGPWYADTEGYPMIINAGSPERAKAQTVPHDVILKFAKEAR